MSHKTIKNIIFDLGGVVINLDPTKSYAALSKLGGMTIEEFMRLLSSNTFFNDYEKGIITSSDFRNKICEMFNKNIPDIAIDTAWNQMLLNIPIERLKTIANLQGNYKLFVLSNTNQIHIDAFEKIIEAGFGLNKYKSLFDKIYYSNHINKRKPDAEIYQYVLQDQHLIPEETLFFEDNRQNVAAAAALNIQTNWVKSNELNLEYIRNEFY